MQQASTIPTITSDRRTPIPLWALLQRHVLAAMSEAALLFAERYTHPDGALRWARDAWKGMDGSDDAYESVYNFPLLVALGGERRLLQLAARLAVGARPRVRRGVAVAFLARRVRLAGTPAV